MFSSASVLAISTEECTCWTSRFIIQWISPNRLSWFADSYIILLDYLWTDVGPASALRWNKMLCHWGRDSPRLPPRACRNTVFLVLTLQDYDYAGVQNGGACYCGNSYGHHGGANETSCHLKCDGWGRQNCGGESQNAIYRSEAREYSSWRHFRQTNLIQAVFFYVQKVIFVINYSGLPD